MSDKLDVGSYRGRWTCNACERVFPGTVEEFVRAAWVDVGPITRSPCEGRCGDTTRRAGWDRTTLWGCIDCDYRGPFVSEHIGHENTPCRGHLHGLAFEHFPHPRLVICPECARPKATGSGSPRNERDGRRLEFVVRYHAPGEDSRHLLAAFTEQCDAEEFARRVAGEDFGPHKSPHAYTVWADAGEGREVQIGEELRTDGWPK